MTVQHDKEKFMHWVTVLRGSIDSTLYGANDVVEILLSYMVNSTGSMSCFSGYTVCRSSFIVPCLEKNHLCQKPIVNVIWIYSVGSKIESTIMSISIMTKKSNMSPFRVRCVFVKGYVASLTSVFSNDDFCRACVWGRRDELGHGKKPLITKWTLIYIELSITIR